MLVLTRKPRESIVINGEEIIITILRIRGNQVAIGIKAPSHMNVHRLEVQQRIDKENRNEGN